MRIAIAGAGMAGAYLFRLLKDGGFDEVDIYDIKKSTRCSSRPCGWGFAPSAEYHRLVSRFTDADAFVLNHTRQIVLDGVAMDADLLTVDKPALIRGLLGDASVLPGEVDLEQYDRIIDATGVERAYLGPTDRTDLIADLVQYRVTTLHDLGAWINTSSIGYEWCFPLGGADYHLGFGSLRPGVEESDLLRYVDDHKHKVQCHCVSRLRLSSPFFSAPFRYGSKVVGVGESIGTVAPMGGDGNLYSMQCAELLADNWEDLDQYVEAVLDKFDWMRQERMSLERLMNGEFPTPGDMRTFLQHARNAGFRMGPVNAVKFFSKAIQTDRSLVRKDAIKVCAGHQR